MTACCRPRVHRAEKSFDRAVQSVTGDDVGAGDRERRHGAAEDVGVEGQIGVHIEHLIHARRSESGAQRAAELAVVLVAEQPDVGVDDRQHLDHGHGVVGRRIVDDYDLVAAAVALERAHRAADGVGDVLHLVEHRDDDGDCRPGAHAGAPTVAGAAAGVGALAGYSSSSSNSSAAKCRGSTGPRSAAEGTKLELAESVMLSRSSSR